MLALTFEIKHGRWMLCRCLGWATPRVHWSPLSTLRLREVPVPEPCGPDWVRLRTLLGGICGTDLALVTLRNHPATFLRAFTSSPMMLGHENVAVIDAVGPGVRGWRVGQRVCVEPSLSCVPRGIEPPCRPCAEGRFSLCENLDAGALPPGAVIGVNNRTGGSWSPYFVAHASQLHAVPDGVSDEAAVLVDPIACALHAVLRRPPADGERLAIVGGGVVGIGVAASLRATGRRNHVTAIVRHRHQGDWMRRYGADDVIEAPRRSAERYDRVAAAVGGRRVPGLFGNQGLIGGFDVVYDCVGTGSSMTDCMKFARAGGTVIVLGTAHISVVDLTPLWFAELTVIGANGRQIEDAPPGLAHPGGGLAPRRLHTYEIVFDLIRDGRLDIAPLLTHTFRLKDYRAAFEALTVGRRQGVIKVAFDHRDRAADSGTEGAST